jgi:hypothetical protein
MGMDVFGKDPSSEKGKYFRSNVWYWRPLWEYCSSVAPKLTNKVKYAGSNDGDGLDAANSVALANVLYLKISSGHTRDFEVKWQKAIDDAPLVKCDFCQQGLRKWEAGSINNDTDQDVYKTCNSCNGTGLVKDMISWYPFSADLVKEFADFLIDSGGFEIW